MTSYSSRTVSDVPCGTFPAAIAPPTLQEWTAAHGIANANRRRVALALLHDRLAASRMKPWQGALYLKRHVLSFVARWVLMGVMALWVSPWMWVPIIGIPLVGLWQAWRDG